MASEEKERQWEGRRCNHLPGKEWMRYSISVWSDVVKTPAEKAYRHPASFPVELARRFVAMFLPNGDHLVLDPFCGIGSTLVAAQLMGKRGVGFDLNPEFARVAAERVNDGDRFAVYARDANDVRLLAPESVDLCINSPPYWDILQRKHTCDGKETVDYGNLSGDLGDMHDYGEFLAALRGVYAKVFDVLKPGAFCVCVVMDVRKKSRLFPLHSDLAREMESIGFEYDDHIIWNRQQEYNFLRPLGYPYRFRVNRVHEYLLFFMKPKA